MLFHCWTGCSTVMYKQDICNKWYGPSVSSCNDYALFLKVLKHIKNGMGYSECLVKYRVRKNSLSRNKLKKVKPYFFVMRKIEQINILLVCFYFFTNITIKLFWKYRKIKKEISK